jgi:ATPase subunit of ABC transporter with duplicated ATPase domains
MGPLAIQGLTKRYGDVVALMDLSLEVKGGEVFGFVGRNGAGKTTAMRSAALSPTCAGGFGPSRRDGGVAAAEELGQQSNTNQHSSLRNRWSSSTRSRISRGS